MDLLTPVLKGWCTELGSKSPRSGVQVHGGMGFIEETGAAQYLRDARIATIYEGTTGIQAGDLVGRKLRYGQRRGHGRADRGDARCRGPARRFRQRGLAGDPREPGGGIHALEQATALGAADDRPAIPTRRSAASVNYMMLTGYVCGGWQMARAALAARARLTVGRGRRFLPGEDRDREVLCRADPAQGERVARPMVKSGASTAFALDEEQF